MAESQARLDDGSTASGSGEYGRDLRLSLRLRFDTVAEVLFDDVYPQRIACGHRLQSWPLHAARCCGQEKQPIGAQRRSNAAEGGLADLHGYLKKGNLVVRMHFPFIEPPAKQPKYIERAIQKSSTGLSKPTAVETSENNEQKLMPQEIKETHDHHLGRSVSAQQEHFFE